MIFTDEAPVETDIQKLRRRIATALATKREAKLAMDCGYEVQLEMRGVKIGTVSTLKKVLDWIDEIAEGSCDPVWAADREPGPRWYWLTHQDSSGGHPNE